MRNLCCALALFITSTVSQAGDLGSQFVTAKLAYGASVSVPKSWQVLRGNEMRAIETAVGAAIDLSGYSKKNQGNETLLVASFPDPELYAGISVASMAVQGVTSSKLATLSEKEIQSGEATIRQGIEITQAKLGTKISGWTALRRVTAGRNMAMHTSYLRSSNFGERRVHLYKFFGVGRIYDLALSTSVVHEGINGVVLERIANSFVAP